MGKGKMLDAFICDATRTPIGRYGGGLATMRPDDLVAHVTRTLIERNPSLDPYAVDEVVLDAPIRLVKTIAMWPVWRCCLLVCR